MGGLKKKRKKKKKKKKRKEKLDVTLSLGHSSIQTGDHPTEEGAVI